MKRTLVFILSITLFLLPFCEGDKTPFGVGEDNDDYNLKRNIEEGDIVITEIMANPEESSDDDGEWFEVYNSTGFTLDLNGVEIKDDKGQSFEISKEGGLLIMPKEFLLLGKSSDKTENGGIDVDYVFTDFSLANDTDAIHIYFKNNLIDSVIYDPNRGFPETPEGASISLDPSFYDSISNDSGENWCEAKKEFSSGDKGTPGEENEKCFGPYIAEGEIIITEIMANPAEVDDEYGEFFEIYNTTDSDIDIRGLEVMNGEGMSFTVETDAGSLKIGRGDYFVFGISDDTVENGGVSVDYVYSDWTLRDTADAIIIVAGDVEVDRVEYDDGVSFPETPEGASMQLSLDAFDYQSNDTGGNWCESTEEMPGGDKGTPGSENEYCS